MDDQLISRLKEFYILETFQVAFYNDRAISAANEYYSKAFEKMVEIEKGHAEFFAEKLDKANIEVPTFTASIFEMAGNFVGKAIKITGHKNTYKLGITLENKAMEMYRKFIKESQEKEYSILRDTLMDYLLDEEFHTLWLIKYMNKRKLQ